MVRLVDLPQENPSVKRLIEGGILCKFTHLDPQLISHRIYLYKNTKRPHTLVKDLKVILGFLLDPDSSDDEPSGCVPCPQVGLYLSKKTPAIVTKSPKY
jgi:hypothetical protein